MADPAKVLDQNLLPVQAYFAIDGTFQTFIGQGQPFYATVNPYQSGLFITSSTIDSTTIGATTPSTGVFTNILSTTGQITTTPSANTDIANKFYVDTVAQGLGPKAACAVATTVNITLSGLQSIDGYTTLSGDRVLVKNQGTSSQNGIYIASASAWTRSIDMDVWSEVPGAYTVILNGSQANTGWVCTATASGTIGVTAMPWVQFSGTATYFAGTGLTLASNTFSITNTGVTAASVGSASKTLTATVNAQGQLTALADTNIAISNSQVSGLGTMSTQNANAVAITGGAINGTTIGATMAAAVTGTVVTANSYFSGAGTNLTGTASGLSIGGNADTATTAASVTNSLTINSGGSGGASPQTYNGGTAVTISYNTVGAPSITGTNASGTWGISITGNSATVTNGLYSTGSYSNPTWLTSILGSIVSGAVSTTTTATNVAGGAAGSLVYQSAAATTTTLALGTTNYVLTAGASAPQYVAQSTLSVGSATTATTATNLAGGGAGYIPYQSGAGATAFLASGTIGQVLTSNGTSAPTWTNASGGVSITDDTSTVTARYPLFAAVTTGTVTTEYVSSTKLQYVPSTGVLTATGFSGSGASLTSLTAGNLSGTIPSSVLGNSTVYIGTTAVLLNRASGSISLTGTSIDGNAGTATTATTATNATNIAITDNTSSSSTYYPAMSVASSGNNPATTSSTKLSFVPSTGILSATGFTGAHNGSIGATTPSTGVFTNVNTPNTFAFKNRIINGAMVIDQRNAGAAQTFTAGAALAYSVDRWYGYCTGANVTGQQIAGGTTPSVTQNRYRFTGAASVTAVGFGQRIEQKNSYDLAGSTCTLSADLAISATLTTVTWTAYYATTTADTFGTLASPTVTQIATGTFTVSSTVTNFSTNISVPAAATTGIQIVFTVGALTAGLTWTIGNVQFEKGAVATSFDYRPYGGELSLCQRYYWRVDGFNGLTAIGSGSVYNNTTTARVYTKFPITMRTGPTFSIAGTITSSGGSSDNAVSSLSAANTGIDSVLLDFTAGVGVIGQGKAVYISSNASYGVNYIQATAEL